MAETYRKSIVTKRNFMNFVRNSIPLKICLSILFIETVLLTLVGVYYTSQFNKEIDDAVFQKLLLPAVLMSERALNYDSASDIEVISEMVQEQVTRCFIINNEGTIYYTEDSSLEGIKYHSLLDEREQDSFSQDLSTVQTLNFTTDIGNHALSVLSPLKNNDKLLGALYIRIDALSISTKKQEVALLFFYGALITIFLTTLIEAYWVYKLIVPRIRRTSKALKKVENYDFSTRLTQYGPPDQLGVLMQQVDHMITRVESHMIDLKEAEKKYKDIFTLASDGIFRSSPNGNLLEANPALALMSGYRSAEEMIEQVNDIGNQCYEVPNDRCNILTLLKEKGKILNHELQLKKRDGSVVTVSLSARTIFNADGSPIYFEGRLTDISEKKEREKQERERQATDAATSAKAEMIDFLEKKNKQLEDTIIELKTTQRQLVQSEKMAMVGLTAGGVAHDLNNILSGIINYPELLLTTLADDSSLRPSIEAILASGRRAAAIVADLLTLSQGAATKRENVSLNQLVEEYLDSLEYQQLLGDAQNVTVHVALAEEPIRISCSPIHVLKVIMNLVMNSVEATGKDGKVSISTCYEEIKLEKNESSPSVSEKNVGRYGVLKITDNGAGIASNDLEHIFEPFYTRKIMGKTGTGLGLTIVQNVIKEHDGHIEVASDTSGTTFLIYLPAEETKEEMVDDTEIIDDLIGAGTVLIIDDEAIQRDVGYRVLQSLGYTVDAVSSGEEATEYLENNTADILIIDMLMPPGINGLETYRRVIEKNPAQKALFVSGFSVNDDVEQALRLGCSRFVQKPYTITNMGRAVKHLLTMPDLTRA